VKIHLVKAALTWCHVQKKNAMFQPSITAKNKHNGATIYIYIVYICFGPAIGRLALTSSGVIGLHRAELFMSELGIGWHREGIGRVHVGPSNKGNLRIQHDLTSERHREGIGKSWLNIAASGNVFKASGNHGCTFLHREMLFSFCSSLHPAAIWGKDHRDLAGGWPLCYGLLSAESESPALKLACCDVNTFVPS